MGTILVGMGGWRGTLTAMTEEVPEGRATERVSVPLVALGKTPSFCWRMMVGNAAPATCRRKREKTTRKVKVLSKGQICQFQKAESNVFEASVQLLGG